MSGVRRVVGTGACVQFNPRLLAPFLVLLRLCAMGPRHSINSKILRVSASPMVLITDSRMDVFARPTANGVENSYHTAVTNEVVLRWSSCMMCMILWMAVGLVLQLVLEPIYCAAVHRWFPVFFLWILYYVIDIL